jgi:putative serine protease PepD
MPPDARDVDDTGMADMRARRVVPRKIALALALAAAAAGALAGGVAGLALDNGNSQPRFAAARTLPAELGGGRRHALTAEELFEADARAVVAITRVRAAKGSVDPLGAGFVIDDTGDVLTKDDLGHARNGIRVGFSGGASYAARLVGADPSTDVAVLRVAAPKSALHPLEFANSEDVEPGDPVYAIGNPLGVERTITAGIVSAVGSDVRAPNGRTIAQSIRTDTPIDHGSSGGPLLDRFGLVVGVSDRAGAGNDGFAVPGNAARATAVQLVTTGRAVHAWLGVRVETIPPGVAKHAHGLPSSGVVVVTVAARSPAAKAGLERATRGLTVNGVGVLVGGDSIVSCGGKRVATAAQLADALAERKPGDRVKLDVVRNGNGRTVSVTLGAVPR